MITGWDVATTKSKVYSCCSDNSLYILTVVLEA
jgi:hypothetical protein